MDPKPADQMWVEVHGSLAYWASPPVGQVSYDCKAQLLEQPHKVWCHVAVDLQYQALKKGQLQQQHEACTPQPQQQNKQ